MIFLWQINTAYRAQSYANFDHHGSAIRRYPNIKILIFNFDSVTVDLSSFFLYICTLIQSWWWLCSPLPSWWLPFLREAVCTSWVAAAAAAAAPEISWCADRTHERERSKLIAKYSIIDYYSTMILCIVNFLLLHIYLI